jgi:uncharacterized Rmd1/YagE family protein
LTDIKGDIILLNPHIPSIELSKIAFSYSLGRAAKLTSIEKSMNNYINHFRLFPKYLEHPTNEPLLSLRKPSSHWGLAGELVRIRQRMITGSQDGFLGTPDFRWARPELQGIVYINQQPKYN